MRLAAVLLLSLSLGGCGDAPPRARHVVLVSVDTLRADRLGAYGYADARTPALDALAAESLRFERAYAHSSMTLPSIATLLTGRVPGRHGVLANTVTLGEGVASLATRLGEAGLHSAAFVGNFALRREVGLARGFEIYAESFRSEEGMRPMPAHSAPDLTDAALAWLDERDAAQRIFLWVHYQEPHGPYEPLRFEPAAAAADEVELPQNSSHSGRGGIPRYQWLGHGRLSEYQARYDAEIAEMDQQLGRLVAGLRERGVLDEAALVFTSDHGEAFGEEGIYCAHGEGLGEALLRVPLLLRVPGQAPGVRRDRVGLAEVAPTLLALAGVAGLDGAGRSLLEDVGDRTVVAQVLGEIGDWNSWRSIRADAAELLEQEPRPGRAQDAPAPEAAALRAALDAVAPWPGASRESDELTAREREGLRALGYLEN